jgi:IgGFc binding protein
MKRSFILLLLLIASHALLFGGMTEEKDIKKHLPGLAGVNNNGTDFWIALPPPYLVNAPGDFFKLYITSPQKTVVTLESPNGLFMQKETLPNDVIVFDVSFAQAQPFNYSCCNDETPEVQIYKGRGMHLFADKAFTVYAVVRIRYTSDGYLAIPTSGIGTEYIAAPYTSRPFKGINSLPNMVTLVAAYDKTKVTMKLGGLAGTSIKVQGKGEYWAGDNDEIQFNLKNKGDVLVIPTIATKQNQTIAGSYFKGTKPFVLISGHFCADIPTDIRACDYNVELDLPMHTWGKHYFVPKIQNRGHSGLLRIFAKEDETSIYRDGQSFGYIARGKGGVLNEGWLENRVWPRIANGDKPKIALYSADKPISITYFNPSAQDDAGSANSDPFAMIITPVEQFQSEIVFCTPAAKGGDQGLNGYKENYLMMIYETEDPSGAPPPDLEWGVIEKTETEWKKVSTVFSGQPRKYTTLDGANGSDDIDWDTPYDGKYYGHLNIQLPGQGVFGVRSVGGLHKFAVYAYGYDTWDSYGWPTAAALLDLSVPDVDAPSVTKIPNCSNTEWNGTTTEEPEDLARRSGFNSVALDYTTSENFTLEFDATKIVPASDIPATHPWRLTVDDPKLPAYGVLIFLDRAGNFTLDTTEYFPPNLNVYEKIAGYDENWDFEEDWGLKETGQVNAETKTFIVENLSESNTFTIAEVLLQKKDEGFAITKINGIDFNTFPWTFDLLPKTSMEIDVEFWTDDQGQFRDFLSIYDCDGGEYAAIELNANSGSAVIRVEDITFDFRAPISYYEKASDNNDERLKNAKTKSEYIFNNCDDKTGTSVLLISDFTGPTNPAFDVSALRADFESQRVDGMVTVGTKPGDSFKILDVKFSPDAPGDYLDSIVFESPNAGPCDYVCILKGTAIESDFAVSGYDWEKNRVFGSYEAIDGLGTKINVLQFVNNSTETESYIKNVVPGGNAKNFEFEKKNPDEWLNLEDSWPTFESMITNGSINKNGEPRIHEIRYAPTVRQVDNFTISFDAHSKNINGVDLYEPVSVTFSGVPILPSMNLYQGDDPSSNADVNFGAMIRGDVSNNPVIKTFTIENTPEDPKFGEVLTVNSIDPNNIAPFGTPWNGTDSYRFLTDIPSGAFTIPIGGTYQFDVEFLAQSEGLKDASITVQHDGDTQKWNSINDNATLNLTGFGQYQNIIITPFASNVCVGNFDDNLEFIITSLADPSIPEENFTDADGVDYSILAPVTIDADLEFLDAGVLPAYESYVTYTPITGVTLDNTNPSVSVPLTYTPGMEIDVKPFIRVTYPDVTDATGSAEITEDEPFEIKSYGVSGNIKQVVKVIDKDGNERNGIPDLNFNDDVIYSLEFNEDLGSNFEDGKATEMEFTLVYREDFLKVEIDENLNPVINIGSGFEGDFTVENIISNIDIVTGMQTITFKVQSTDPDNIFIMGNDREIVNVKFTTFLPSYTNEDKDVVDRDKTSIFSVNIETRLVNYENDCAKLVYVDEQELKLSVQCVYEYKDFVFSGVTTQAPIVNPSPVNQGSDAKMSFSMGFGGPTTIQLINLEGKVVETLFEGDLEAGYQELTIPTNSLDNGVYFYEIISTNYKYKDKFLISK